MLATLNLTALQLLGQVPDPGSGKKPPGADRLTELLSWAAWIAFGVCVLGVIVAGGAMALGSRRGEGGEHMSRLGWALGGCIVIGAASSLVGALV